MLIDLLHRLIGIIVLTILLARLSDWVSTHLQGIGYLVSRNHQIATFFMFLVLAPGIFVHEFSHWIIAKLLGVRTKGFRVWPKRTPRGKIQLGAVQVQGAGPVSLALIGVAPFLLGMLALVLLGGWLLTAPPDMADWRHWFALDQWKQEWAFFRRANWPWRFYAMWLIGSSMMPSAPDREPLRPVLIVLVGMAVAAYVAGVAPAVPEWVYKGAMQFLDRLAAAFWLAILGNVLVATVLAVVEEFVARVFGVRVAYN